MFVDRIDRSKLLNVVAVVLLFLSWVATCVVFGGGLHTGTVLLFPNGSVKFTFYWNQLSTGSNSLSYASDSQYQKCQSGGQGLLTFAVFAFLLLLVSLTLIILRLLHRAYLVPFIGDSKDRYLRTELVSASVISFFFFLLAVIWGGSCFTWTLNSAKFDSTTATGFAYICVCLFFMIAATVLLYYVRRDEIVFGPDASLIGGARHPDESIPSSSVDPTSNFPSALSDATAHANDV